MKNALFLIDPGDLGQIDMGFVKSFSLVNLDNYKYRLA
jgi:hypothetical protein